MLLPVFCLKKYYITRVFVSIYVSLVGIISLHLPTSDYFALTDSTIVRSLHSAWEKQMAALSAEAAELHAEVGALRNLLNEKNAQVRLEEYGLE